MNYNYHTHTPRCGHATGTEEEYILRALNGGIKHMGFSDHFPFAFPDGRESSFRVPVAEAKAYVAELSALREKYQDQIELKIGFEMEYYPCHFDRMLKNAQEYGAEYLIMAQHFLYEEYPNGISAFAKNDSLADLKEFAAQTVAGIQTGVFSYIAHPDVFNFVGSTEAYRQEMRKICVAARECNIPLEINFLGIRTGRCYPNEAFWQVAGEEKSPVTFGLDAHQSQDAWDPQSYTKAMAMVERYKLHYIGTPKLIPLKKP